MAISVIIPALNEEKYLPVCLTALQNQTKKACEIIVIDNGSTDKTSDVARKFGAKVILEQKRGIIPARQKGFKVAKGAIIARTDADSIPPPTWLAEIEKTFRKFPTAVAVSGPIAYSDAPKLISPLLNTAAFLYPHLISTLLRHSILVGANFALKKEVAIAVKPHLDDRLVHEDIDLSCHLAKKGPIVFNKHMLMKFSARRITKNPTSFFGEYPLRFLRTLYLNHFFLIGPHRQSTY